MSFEQEIARGFDAGARNGSGARGRRCKAGHGCGDAELEDGEED